ncbi:MAG: ParB/RepB/Spo0J family partition protein [Bifidobacteriaceae bacterium]|jgi:ParB family chromosome partitioning protein|nr:ParB/RepB/Spo0J family partition protein [Bifidobacteriaceae bacterium]
MAGKKRSLGRGLGALIPNKFRESAEDAEPKEEESSAGEAQTAEKAETKGQKITQDSKRKEDVADDSGDADISDTQEIKLVRKEPTDILFGSSSDYASDDEMEVVSASYTVNWADKPGYYDEVAIESIVPNKNQPRTIFDEADLQELSESITEVGVLQPIIVREILEEDAVGDEKYEIVMGERRYRASKLAGLAEVPVIVKQTSDDNMLRDALLENIHRVDLNPLEEAAAYQQLLQEFDITQDELSSKIAVSRSTIANTLRLLKLPASVQQKVAANVLTAGHARAILSLKNTENVEKLANKIVRENLSVRNAEEVAAIMNAGGELKKGSHAGARRKLPDINEKTERIIENIMDTLDTEVLIRPKKTGGSILISYADEEDLKRIGDVIAGEL